MTTVSLIEALATDGFGEEHLPYGAFSTDGAPARLGVRLGDHALALEDLAAAAGTSTLTRFAGATSLDPVLQEGPDVWDTLRGEIRDALRLSAGQVPAASLAQVSMHMPFTVADYVDFYASEHHAANVGSIFRPGQPALLPNWKHLPVSYHGRAGTVSIEETIMRPAGLRPEPSGTPSFGPSRRLDIEAEMGFVVGGPATRRPVGLAEAADRLFGVVLVNDWSARDIQAFEYVPLGPNLSKSFATSIAPWVTPWAALTPARVRPPEREVALSRYLDDAEAPAWALDIEVEVLLNNEPVSRPNSRALYWTAPQMVAHMTVNGATLRPGDFFASGTISGPERTSRGSFLELSWGGAEPLRLQDGTEVSFLRDGDEVVLRARATGRDGVIELGECRGRIVA